MAKTKVLLLDGYIDEPAALGVRPYLHPLVRASYGAALDAGAEVQYLSIDHLRRGEGVPSADVTMVLAGSSVPGRYIRSLPASTREIEAVVSGLSGFKVLGGPATIDPDGRPGGFDASAEVDPAASLHDLLVYRTLSTRWRTLDEWNEWLIKGAEVACLHPDFPEPLVAEVETYRGCLRYRGGGCSFCMEPLKGSPLFREEADIIQEVKELQANGVRHFRLGAQTCFVSYKAHVRGGDIIPRPDAVERLLSHLSALKPTTLHLDNANPAVIADHPEEARRILGAIVRYCTSGNILALGMETADPQVVSANNLNAQPEQVMEAIALINEIGGEMGETGLPRLLPGLNFIVGLDGESARTLTLNLDFLREVRKKGYLLRRINIRQVLCVRRGFTPGVSYGQFWEFKRRVREEIDRPMLEEMLPPGSVLRNVYLKLMEGNRTFGRQIGTYPLLVGLNYPLETERYLDVSITDWGARSVTAVEYPLPVNTCPMAALSSLPEVGRKRTARLVRGRPFRSIEEVAGALQDEKLAARLEPYLAF